MEGLSNYGKRRPRSIDTDESYQCNGLQLRRQNEMSKRKISSARQTKPIAYCMTNSVGTPPISLVTSWATQTRKWETS